jgi:IS4 transposase
MLSDQMLARFAVERPAAVMVRGALEYAFADGHLDEIFRTHATSQYEHRLLFSSLVGLLGAVVMRSRRSVLEAYRSQVREVGVSLSSVYDKLNHTDISVTEALLGRTAARLGEVASSWPGTPSPIPGYAVKIVDGNHLAGTDHRLAVLRGHGSAALPGMAVVVMDHASGLMTHLFGSPDGHQSERALIGRLLEAVRPGQLWIADRHYCTVGMMEGIAARGACFIIRHHAQIHPKPVGARRKLGRVETGVVWEQEVAVGAASWRMVTLALDEPTVDGETEIRLLTNLPATVSGQAIARAYRQRWKLENAFQEVTLAVQCELNTLGYPRAALLTFSLALCICNALRVAVRALEQARHLERQKGAATRTGEKAEREFSGYYIVGELNRAYDGMDMMVDPETWRKIRDMSAGQLADWLVRVGKKATFEKYLKTKSGPKKQPATPTVGGRRNPHRSTFRLLQEKQAALAKTPRRP